MTLPTPFNKLKLETILFTRPEKRANKILTFAYTKDHSQANHVILQTNRSILSSVDLETGKIKVTGSEDFNKFLSKMNNYLVHLLGNHGKFFFGGKQYPLDRIQSSFLSPVQSDGTVMFRLRSNGMTISDQFGKKIPINTLKQLGDSECIVLLQFDGLCFTRSTIEPIFTVINMRVYTVANADEYTINPNEDDDDTVTFRPTPVPSRLSIENLGDGLGPSLLSTPLDETVKIAQSEVRPPSPKKMELPVVFLDNTSNDVNGKVELGKNTEKTDDDDNDNDNDNDNDDNDSVKQTPVSSDGLDGAKKVMLVEN